MDFRYEKIKKYVMAEALNPERRHRLPSLRELAKQFQVSMGTVIRAMKELQFEGIISNCQGARMTSRIAPHTLPPGGLTDSSAKTILYVTVDYFAEDIWNMKYSFAAYSRQKHFNFMTLELMPDSDPVAEIRNALKTQSFAGIVLVPTAERLETKTLEYLGTTRLPVFLPDSLYLYSPLPDNVHFLRRDWAQSGRLCVQALAEAGHRTLACLRNEPESDMTREFQKGCVRAAADLGVTLTCYSAALQSWEDSMAAAVKLTEKHLADILRTGVGGLIFTTSVGAFAAMRVLLKNGLRLPADMSLIGTGDSFSIRSSYPAISTVICPEKEFAVKTLDMLDGTLPLEENCVLPPRLIARESIALKESIHPTLKKEIIR